MQTLREIAGVLELSPEQLTEPITKHLMVIPDNQRNPMARLLRAVDAMLGGAEDYDAMYEELSAAARSLEYADEETSDAKDTE